MINIPRSFGIIRSIFSSKTILDMNSWGDSQRKIDNLTGS